MQQIMSGNVKDTQIAAFLLAMRAKHETIEEIYGVVAAIRELAWQVPVDKSECIDIVGTGGDGANLFNVSTAAALVTSAAGVKVAKHGNIGMTSTSGSADLLSKAGVKIDLAPDQVKACIDRVGIGFMFAPIHHPAMKFMKDARQDLGVRTLMNLVGPLCNPAMVTKKVIGVYQLDLCKKVAEVMKLSGCEHVLVVHAADGLDEISIYKETSIAELKDGDIKEYSVEPRDIGVNPENLEGLQVSSVSESLGMIKSVLGLGSTLVDKKARKLIAANAGAALYVAGSVKSLKEGTNKAFDIIDSGLGLEKLQELASFTQTFKS